jgi:hypothetical protein
MFVVKEMHIHSRIYIPEIKRILLTGIMLRDKVHKCDCNRPRQACAGCVSTAGHLDRRDCYTPGKTHENRRWLRLSERHVKFDILIRMFDDTYRCQHHSWFVRLCQQCHSVIMYTNRKIQYTFCWIAHCIKMRPFRRNPLPLSSGLTYSAERDSLAHKQADMSLGH